jgi:ABC-type dipeptide/oligopeptide/nickel transport system permease component
VGGYVLRRLWQTVPVLFGVSLLAFAVMHVVPGDPVRLIAGPDAPESVVERNRLELGLDRPLHEQYWSFLHRALRGDLGRSLRSRAPVADGILARFPATLELTTASMVIAVLVGVPTRSMVLSLKELEFVQGAHALGAGHGRVLFGHILPNSVSPLDAPHVSLFPGIAIFLTVMGFNCLGDGLRDALDPRMRARVSE